MAKKSKEFSERFEKLIRQRNLNLKKFSEKTGITYSAIWSYVNEGVIPEAPILYKLAKELNVFMEYLLTGDHPESQENLIDLNRRRYEKDSDLQGNLELFIQYWQTGNPEVRELFSMSLKMAGKLLEKQPSPARWKVKKKGM